MGLIIRDVGILGSKNNYKRLKALFDTGATCNYISKNFSDEETIDDVRIVEYHGSDFVTFPDGFEKNGLIYKFEIIKN